ncbi:MAG TPA: AbrB/MazE/SpoVT family DNA-binding domain-containing protein [Steroidobacteraceae bacterium]|nr:AbrB/MazE/SpoVT family DNA-binding domain-containing protein [Steroidobacteraceae bacterium]
MRLTVRRIGNSLGVIVPRPTLRAWNLKEGDELELTATDIRPPTVRGFSHDRLDELKRSISLAVVDRFKPGQIRAQILANLHRWKTQGTWVSAYDEWKAIAENEDDGRLFAAMLGRDEEATRLRQSMPFVGLLSQEQVRSLNEEAAA